MKIPTKITSGRINSKSRINVKISNNANNPTVVEARIKLPKTYKGLWPAFWMLGTDFDGSNWPSCGEIDIMEMGNAEGIIGGQEYSKRYMTVALHVLNNDDSESNIPVHGDPDGPGYYDKIDLQDGEYHTFKVKYWGHKAVNNCGWLNKITYEFYIDDVLIKTLHPCDDADKNNNVFTSLNKEFFIVFNLAVGGKYTGIPTEPQIYAEWSSLLRNILNGGYGIYEKITALNKDNNYTAKMYVDWVKVSGGGNAKKTDDFDNLDNWNISEGRGDSGWGNAELQEYTAKNISIEYDLQAESNCLVITAKSE
ncbi:MAG: glycoside hydrolase family 16 protein [Elusimicrobiota bacterium]|nr:glycoside hydrolase family 16 protein [Elusimicrobiota bacterium]